MRIAIINWTSRRVGGIETYLSTVIPQLERTGHEIAFWHEVDEPRSRERIYLPQGASSWCAKEIGARAALRALAAWQPDVIYSHKVEDPHLEAETLRIAPAVYFAHDYQGMCISGLKSHKFPVIRPCGYEFGSACLARYFPKRCGGLSPVTMFKLYRLQTKRRELLHQYRAIVTHSGHMLDELIKHGLPARHAYSFPYYVQPGDTNDEFVLQGTAHSSWRLLFSGRMERLKGAHVFLSSLLKVKQQLRKPLHVTFVGDGRMKEKLERQAKEVVRHCDGLTVDFRGWVSRDRIDSLLDQTDLLVVPSLWPEPFGLVGPEAGLRSVPVAAFDVGGISNWLENGINGYLAPGDPPTANGLAGAIVRCLSNPITHARLRRGALAMSQRYTIKNHLTALLSVFENVVGNKTELGRAATAS